MTCHARHDALGLRHAAAMAAEAAPPLAGDRRCCFTGSHLPETLSQLDQTVTGVDQVLNAD